MTIARSQVSFGLTRNSTFDIVATVLVHASTRVSSGFDTGLVRVGTIDGYFNLNSRLGHYGIC